MNAAGRLALYGAGLVVAFGAAFAVAGAVIPDDAAASWAQDSNMNSHGTSHSGHEQATETILNGVSVSQNGYELSPVQAPATVGEAGELSFQILDAAGDPVTEYATAHDKDLHLIVVRTDGVEFRHVHPELDTSTGTWSTPWSWDAAGTYRVYADFTPAADGAEGLTLTRGVEVAGDFAPVEAEVQTVDEVDGFTVSITGDLAAGTQSDLTVTVERDGEPVTTLEPYLAAYGHLVALREGDLAYLHVHAEGDAPEDGVTAGPEIEFAAHAPTADRYLLYFDFQVGGQVHTAEFVLDTVPSDGAQTDDSHSGH
ncbi:hypothetical protein [Gulosibacter sp. ACHW.36C]|uniref:Heavy metal-binding domain-containing protein n=1 Tax=Gulosibacter sediminis TaxID=1729695 RepID=A0ABY4MZ40_9MICO|nr:hypothetical protein [Gulosibacter sediminis]UQN15707.1 hypothetical protein M3M28_04435 [Gulosibacter sediminis]